MKEFPRKFLSLRDKHGSHSRSKSAPPSNKARPLSTETFLSFFKSEHKSKADLDQTNETEKVREIQKLLDQLNITNVTPEHIKDIMATSFAEGDPKLTVEFIDIEQKSTAGTILRYDPSTHMLGAENRGGVTCYIDSLLFAMFCKLDAFECMLKTQFAPENPRNRLVNLLRVWVNLLRSGKLIHAELTKLIQDSLGDCGWSDARLLEQQDTSEAFAFLTETLQLPLLSLQVDLFHQGKRDKDDHKVVYERLLNLAVPPDTDGKGIKLEDCLEEYFNAQVDVLRDSEESKKPLSEDMSHDGTPTLVHRNTIRLLREEGTTAGSLSTSASDLAPLQSFPTSSSTASTSSIGYTEDCIIADQTSKTTTSETNEEGPQTPRALPRQLSSRTRSGSVIQRVVLDNDGTPKSEDAVSFQSRRKGSVVVKAVTIPAWQFFRLIPWHAVTRSEPQNDQDVAMNFEQKPVVGICLKRYLMNNAGQPQRHNTFIDIPDSLRLPRFMIADNPESDEEANGLSTEYKLVLQSVVCHRGDSLQSGHYITFARVAPKLLTENRRTDFDPPPDYEEAQWVLFDDLEVEKRVSYVDNIKKSLREEMPYLLFYQVVPMVDVVCPSVDGTASGPPSYQESRRSLELRTSGGPTESTNSIQSKPPSIRLSFEADPSAPSYFDSVGSVQTGGSTLDDSRRQSLNVMDANIVTPTYTPAITPDSHSPVLSATDESTASRLSRAATRFALGRQSRPTSQSGEGRMSLTMSRISGFRRTSREPLTDDTTSSSATLVTTDTSDQATADGFVDDVEKTPYVSQTKLGHKTGKSRDRGKAKPVKQKEGSPPERECIVM